jgi:hypothetical protein
VRAREKKPRNQCMKIEQVLNAKTNADTLTQRRADRTTSTHTRTHAKTHKDAHARAPAHRNPGTLPALKARRI